MFGLISRVDEELGHRCQRSLVTSQRLRGKKRSTNKPSEFSPLTTIISFPTFRMFDSLVTFKNRIYAACIRRHICRL